MLPSRTRRSAPLHASLVFPRAPEERERASAAERAQDSRDNGDARVDAREPGAAGEPAAAATGRAWQMLPATSTINSSISSVHCYGSSSSSSSVSIDML